jgi:beta-glucosidase
VAPGDSLAATVSAEVTDTGERPGADVAQLYLGLPSQESVPQPPLQLKGTQKVALAPGEATKVSFPIDLRSLSYWDTAAGTWKVAPGCYRVLVGRSSGELPLQGTLAVEGAHCPSAIATIPPTR